VKLIHLSTSLEGGAGLTAIALASLQSQFGHHTQVVSESRSHSSVNEIKSKFSTLVSLANATKSYSQVTHFSSSTIDIDEIKESNPDVVFVHNWFNLLSLQDLIEITNLFPTIFVAHDARLATGGCHVTLGCKRHHLGCSDCPAAKINFLASHAKRSTEEAVQKFGNYALVTPSNWLMQEIAGSGIMENATFTKVISNPSNATMPVTQTSGIKIDGNFQLLFIASDLRAKYKGIELLVRSLKLLDENRTVQSKINIKIIGHGEITDLPRFSSKITLEFLGRRDIGQVHRLMSESDALIVPSLSENFPGVIGEAQLMGCFVIASNIGGIPEMIENEVSGLLFEPNPISCMNSIVSMMNLENKSSIEEIARKRALRRHDRELINFEYDQVIEKLTQQ
jgi:glycosyltransferase involved in cell wall biosynthesis